MSSTKQQTNGQTDNGANGIADEIPDTVQRRAHYDDARKTYWTTDDRGDWIEVNESGLRLHLREDGLKGGKPEKGKKLSEVDQRIVETQRQQNVAYAGPLAGHSSGPAEQYGRRILVTQSPTLIEPAAGKWPVLCEFLDSLLFDEEHNQQQYVWAWLKIAYETLRDKSWRGGPAMALAGPRDCGKSLLQNLFTEILGGRAAKPYRYMSGNTQFNADLFGAEHLVIEDEHSSTDIRARRAFGSNIKQFTSNQAQSCHGKGRNALTLAPFWRVSISVNDEPENMMVLPPLSDSAQDSIADKIILLKAQKADLTMPTTRTEDFKILWDTLTSELPAFLAHLVSWKIPEEIQHGRFGVKAWQHPELLAALDTHAPETRLLALIDEQIFPGQDHESGEIIDKAQWEGTAERLERLLTDSSTLIRRVSGAEFTNLVVSLWNIPCSPVSKTPGTSSARAAYAR